MQSNVRCCLRPAVVPLIAMLSLSACATAGSDVPLGVCPPVVDYSRTEQARAATEVGALPEGAMIVTMLGDYAVLRDQARACAES
ncbi:MAG: hypothetical protein CVT70_17705 [Alphaproteobacteria bacterium HGW-Alphaproteobacteria-1]|nr:MAG: hypothetical protein CVT70_17705 [Alphaproteobacteria bacterium HGW-Alphaproteobacteria-1]